MPVPHWGLQLNGIELSSHALGMKIRLLLQAGGQDFLFAESNSDTSALADLLADGIEVRKAQGKANCVGAHAYLSEDERRRVLFLVDCDGEDNSKILGIPSMIISSNRDLESDMFFVLRSYERLILTHLAERDGGIGDFRIRALECLNFVVHVTTLVGQIRDLAVARGLPTKIFDESTQKKRKVGVRDIGDLAQRCISLKAPLFEDLLAQFQSVLDWPSGTELVLSALSRENATKPCRAHSLPDCLGCRARRFANGHDLIDLGARVLHSQILGLQGEPDYRNFERNLRLAIVSERCLAWATYDRMRRYERWSGKAVLKERLDLSA